MSEDSRVQSVPPSGRAYLCPLDKADNDFPELTFGPNRIARFTAAELGMMLNVPRSSADVKIFERFTWLMIGTQVFEPDRLAHLLSKPMNSDFAEIEPHQLRFAAVVEDALFVVLLAPWEDWVDNVPGFWQPFEVPWVRRVGGDPSVRRQPPLSADLLSWDRSPEGEFIMPEQVKLKVGDAAHISSWLNDSRWEELARAQEGPLFDTPVKHFFVKAFLEEPLDEFLAYITTIEAALGLESDYRGRGATERVAARVSALIGASCGGERYRQLFNLRCTYLHGRKMNAPISGEVRLMARRLAREVVNKLTDAALNHPRREDRIAYLNEIAN
jgi:hypothetical protein